MEKIPTPLRKKPGSGISGYSLDEDLANQVGVDQTSGILVASVTNGGPAYEAGIRMGDVITAADGSTVTSFEDLSKLLGSKKPGDTITLTVERAASPPMCRSPSVNNRE